MAICLWGTGLPSRVDWLFILLSVALGGAVFGGVFFIGANLAGVKFESRVSDETKIRGSNVEHITHINAYDDAKLDMWLDRYVFARNLFGGLIIPLLIFAGLFFFAV
ncbi:MAG: hypothetical protein AAF829_02325 [Pseudomonadota bacterium]